MKVWVYFQDRDVKLFATEAVATSWFETHDPEGVAFEHDVLTEAAVSNTGCYATLGSAEVKA